MDPESHINSVDRANIFSEFESLRGEHYTHGPAMYIISPSDRNPVDDSWEPTHTQTLPERVVLSRIQTLAKLSHDHLINKSLSSGLRDDKSWVAVFQENPGSLKSYSALLRIHSDYLVCSDYSSTSGLLDLSSEKGTLTTSYTRSLEKKTLGPKPLRKKLYKNLSDRDSILVS